MHLIAFALCADGPAHPRHYAFHDHQQALILKFFRSEYGQGIPLQQALLVPATAQNPEDICAWRGLMCTDGAVTTLVTNASVLRGHKVDMRWLPSSLKFGHFNNIETVCPWESADLPRALKYLFLTYDFRAAPNKLDMRRLPPTLEELFLAYVVEAGPIHLSNLPRPIRILFVRTVRSPTVFVDNFSLRENLRHAIFQHDAGKSKKIVVVGGQAADPRVRCASGSWRLDQESWYHNRINLISEALGSTAKNAW